MIVWTYNEIDPYLDCTLYGFIIIHSAQLIIVEITCCGKNRNVYFEYSFGSESCFANKHRMKGALASVGKSHFCR